MPDSGIQMHKAAARQACLAPFASFRPFVCMTPALAVVYNFSSSSLILMSLHLRHFILPAIGSLALFGATVAAPQTPPSSATNIPQKAVASSRIPPAPARKQAVKNKRQPPKASLAQPAPPPPPPTLEQMPASPPQVSFQNGQLSIAARNSTLADILSAVQRTTGAAVDAPATPSSAAIAREPLAIWKREDATRAFGRVAAHAEAAGHAAAARKCPTLLPALGGAAATSAATAEIDVKL